MRSLAKQSFGRRPKAEVRRLVRRLQRLQRNGRRRRSRPPSVAPALLRRRSVDVGTLRAALGDPEIESVSEGIDRLFPTLGTCELDDGPIATFRATTMRLPLAGSYKMSVLDWAADPSGDRRDRLAIQTLVWLARSDASVETQAAVVHDWATTARDEPSRIELLWDQHAVAARTNSVIAFLRRYLTGAETVSRAVLESATWILLTHIQALCDKETYSVRHNHGLMQDRALIVAARYLSMLEHSDALIAYAEQRMRTEQVERSVTPDTAHCENSPHYHAYFVETLSSILHNAYVEFGATPPDWLVEQRNVMLDSLLSFVKPDFTLPQFGDTVPQDVRKTLRRVRRQADLAVPLPADVNSRVDYIVSGGKSGDAPKRTHHVFQQGGYAVFRDGWNPLGELVLSVKTHRSSVVHSHLDDGTFELFAHGQTVVVDSGRFSNDRSSAMARYSTTPEAHNVLTIDGAEFASSPGNARLIDAAVGATVSWVRCGHEHFDEHGVKRYERIAAVDNVARRVVILDLLSTTDRIVTRRHLHIQPDFADVTSTTPSALVARRSDKATVAVATDNRSLLRPVSGDEGPSFYFPAQLISVPSVDACGVRSLDPGVHLLTTTIDLDAARRGEGPPVQRGTNGKLLLGSGDALALPEDWQQQLRAVDI